MTTINLEVQINKNHETKCDDCGRSIKIDEEFYQYEVNKEKSYQLCGDCNEKRD